MMKAMVIDRVQEITPKGKPLRLVEIPIPEPSSDEVLVRISVCGVCHTELDEIEGRTPPSRFPMVPGHQVVGNIVKTGSGVSSNRVGERVGVAWIFSACGECGFCKTGMENLCDNFLATGRDANGGYAEYMSAPIDNVYKIPDIFTDAEAAPLLCAGAVGYRALSLAEVTNGDFIGLTGFGASAHIIVKLLRYQQPETKIFVFARREEERGFAKELGAFWVGDITDDAPEKLNAIIDTTPAWKPVVEGLRNLQKAGRLVINAIRKEDQDKSYLQYLSYKNHLWNEKEIKSVANITTIDVNEFLTLADEAKIKPHVEEFPIEAANKVLAALKFKKIKGAKVLRIAQMIK